MLEWTAKRRCIGLWQGKRAFALFGVGLTLMVLVAGISVAGQVSKNSMNNRTTVRSQATSSSSRSFTPRWVSRPSVTDQLANKHKSSGVRQIAYSQASDQPTFVSMGEASDGVSPFIDEYDGYQPRQLNRPHGDTFTPSSASRTFVNTGHTITHGSYSTSRGTSGCGTSGGCGNVQGSCGNQFGAPQRWGPGDFYGGCRKACCNSCLWVRAEALLWWLDGFQVPTLATSSAAASPVAFVNGTIDNGTVLFGNGPVLDEMYSGGRIQFGCWLDRRNQLGVEANFFGLNKESDSFSQTSTGATFLARPFFDIQAPGESAWPVALENVFSGSIDIDVSTELLGTEVLFRRAMVQRRHSRVDVLLGYRFARLDDVLGIRQTSTALADATLAAPDTTMTLLDRFETSNRFHGVDIGVTTQTHCGGWTLEALMKVAFGRTHSYIDIAGGASTTVPPADPVASAAGFLAQSTNIGQFDESHFSMIPELGVTVGHDITCNLRMTCGYSLFYWSKVARPGDQIDTDLNLARTIADPTLHAFPPTTSAGASHPRSESRFTDMWAQGINLGLDYRF